MFDQSNNTCFLLSEVLGYDTFKHQKKKKERKKERYCLIFLNPTRNVILDKFKSMIHKILYKNSVIPSNFIYNFSFSHENENTILRWCQHFQSTDGSLFQNYVIVLLKHLLEPLNSKLFLFSKAFCLQWYIYTFLLQKILQNKDCLIRMMVSQDPRMLLHKRNDIKTA